MAYNDEKDKKKFNKEAFKHAISMLESSGGKFLDSKTSSAAGKYHFLWNIIKDNKNLKGVSKREFMADSELQELIMDEALEGKLEGYPGYINFAERLQKDYGSNLDPTKLAALTHFLGAGNVRKYLKNPSEFNVPGVNKTPEEYMLNFDKYFNNYKSPEDKQPSITAKETMHLGDNEYNFKDPSLLEQPKDNTNIPMPVLKKMAEPELHPSQHVYNENKRMDQVANEFEHGGGLHSDQGADESVTVFEGGGSHEQNPLGGIPQGIGQNGKQNLVEEGETKWNDYIFSNEIKL